MGAKYKPNDMANVDEIDRITSHRILLPRVPTCQMVPLDEVLNKIQWLRALGF